MNIDSSAHRDRAFTLLEILVAMSILTLIVSLLTVVMSEVGGVWKSAEAYNQRRASGRALLQFIAQDLKMAQLHPPYPEANSTGLRFVANEPSLIPVELLNPHAAFWQAPVAINQNKGDLAEIGYFVRWDTSTQPGTAKAQLCRFLVDPADDIHYRVYSGPDEGGASWLDLSTIDSVASATAAEDYRGWFADDVIALWLRCLDREGNPILETADGIALNHGYGFDSSRGYGTPSTNHKQFHNVLPASIEIVLATVDAHTARRITTPIIAWPNSPENFWKDKTIPGSIAHFVASLPQEIQPGVQVFSTRVFLKNALP